MSSMFSDKNHENVIGDSVKIYELYTLRTLYVHCLYTVCTVGEGTLFISI